MKAVRRVRMDQGEVLSAVTHGSWKRVDLQVVINQANPDFPVIVVPGLTKIATIRNRLIPEKAVADLTNRDLSTSRRDLIDPIVAIDQVDLIDPTILGINEPQKEVKETDLPVDLANRAVSTNPRSLAISEFSKPRFSDDSGDKKPFNREKPIERDREGRVSKPSSSSGVKGLAKFKPRGANSEENQSEERNTPTQKTYGIPKAERVETPIGFKGSKREYNRVTSNLEKGTEHANSNEIRLNRYIANSGICSRREADDLILQGLVRVNGEIVKELGTKVTPYDVVKVEDRKVVPEKPVYIIMNKPKGFITTTDDPEGRKTVMELIDLPGKERIYPIGRLDRNTTGVLLLTNDGEMAQKLMHPSFEIKKVYRATLDRKPTKEHMMQLVEGVELEDGMMAFEQCGFVEEGKDTVLGIEIKSGRNRIVRRMFEHFGYEVTGLDRVLLGEFDKVKLGRGKWRFLTEKEMNYVDRLKRTKAKKPKA